MVGAALADGTADRDCVFEVFARRLPHGRRYGVVAGTGRLLEALPHFRFGDDELAALREQGLTDQRLLDWLADFRFTGDIDGYAEGELYFPGSPVLTVRGAVRRGRAAGDARAVGAQPRQRDRLGRGPDGGRGLRAAVHRDGLAAHPRGGRGRRGPGGVPGRASPRRSNLEAGRRYGVPTAGTSAHAFTLLHDDEAAAFRAQVGDARPGTTLLVDTYDVDQGIRTAVEVAGPELGAVRLDSGDLPDAGPARPRAAGRARRDEDPDRASPATSTSTPSPACRRPRSTATAWAPRWSPAPAPRPRAWSTSWSSATAVPVAKRSEGKTLRGRPQARRAPARRATGRRRRGGQQRRPIAPARRRPRPASSRWCAAGSRSRATPGRGAAAGARPTTSACGRRCRRRRWRCPGASRCCRP